MGRARRPQPARLAEKLLEIRTRLLGMTQEQMVKRLNYGRSSLYPAHISEYEQGKREPPLEVILLYARIAGVPMEMLVDDKLDVVAELPSSRRSAGIKRRSRS